MYPLKFRDNFHEAIWGGQRLSDVLGKALPSGRRIGESWELSGHPRGISVVANGAFKGQAITDLLKKYPEKLIGISLSARFDNIPVLVKFIDASDKLSIQVHPDDAYAAAHLNGRGKSEAWYIVDASDNASVLCGFKDAITADDARRAIGDGDFEKYLCRLGVSRGDPVFIPAGTAHAVMEGVLLYEIQEMSDVTYRISDWGRILPDGSKRALNIDDALAVMRCEDASGHRTRPVDIGDAEAGRTICVASRYFILEKLRVVREVGRVMTDSFDALTFLCGSGKISCDGCETAFTRGETILMPAGLKRYKMICDAPTEALLAYVPGSCGSAIDALRRDGLSDNAIKGLGDLFE